MDPLLDVKGRSTGANSDMGEPGTSRSARLLRWSALALILVTLVLLGRALPMPWLLEALRERIDALGYWGPLALGLIYVIATLLLVPGSLLTLLAAATYGLALGMVIVSLASTTAAALAFLIARYAARDAIARRVRRSPQLSAVDRAIGEQGWKIVALLRLSPVVPFNLQNYLYGVTAIRFWPCILTSWVAMLPGTFFYVYLGAFGHLATRGSKSSSLEWTVRIVGLIATIVVTVLLTRIARRAIRQHTELDGVRDQPRSSGVTPRTRSN